MLIRRDQIIADRPAVEVREMMRALYRAAHSGAALVEKFAVGRDTSESLIEDLQAEGLIEVRDESGPYVVTASEAESAKEPVLWRTTVRGTALAKARIGVPMQRSTAQELLDSVVKRAKEVNQSDEWLHWVVEAQLYGSFAREGDEPVGDVDLGVRLRARYEDMEHQRRQDEMIKRDAAHPGTILAHLQYAENKLLLHLRGSSPRIDLVEFHEKEPLPPGATSRLVYRFDPPGPTRS